MRVSLHEHLIELLSPASSERVLDIGCGRGYELGMLLECVPQGQVVAVDPDMRALDACVSRYRDQLAAGRLELAQTELRAGLPFPNQSFDRVLCNDLVEWIPAPFKLTDAAARVLRPGGTLVLGQADYRTIHWSGVDRELTGRLVAALLADPGPRARVRSVYDSEQLVRVVADSRFEKITSEVFVEQDHGYQPGSTGRMYAESIVFCVGDMPGYESDVDRFETQLSERAQDPELEFTIEHDLICAQTGS